MAPGLCHRVSSVLGGSGVTHDGLAPCPCTLPCEGIHPCWHCWHGNLRESRGKASFFPVSDPKEPFVGGSAAHHHHQGEDLWFFSAWLCVMMLPGILMP